MKRLALVALPLLLATPARAWDANAHKVIGVIAHRHLTPEAKAWCDGILTTNQAGYRTFLDAAPYPDYLKHGSPKKDVKIVRRFDAWHFIDWPVRQGHDLSQPYDTSLEKNGDNVLYGIKESIQSMTTGLESTRGFYMAMLIHLVGDAHQPLHCCERDGDKGGNGFPIHRGSITNLHALWDDAITERYQLRALKNHSDERIRQVANEVEREVPLKDVVDLAADLDPKDWAVESYGLAVDSAYADIAPGDVPSEGYEARWYETAEARVALAGYRLAGLLNRLAAER